MKCARLNKIKMTKISFIFNKEKELYNLWDTVNSKNSYGFNFSERIPNKIFILAKDKTFEDFKNQIENIKINDYLYESVDLKELAKFLEIQWDRISEEFDERLRLITGKQVIDKKINSFLISFGKCSYNLEERYFFVSFFSNNFDIKRIIAHELFHFHFHNYYFKSLQDKIGKSLAQDIKEALTVLLNIEFKDLIFVPDKGYEKHKDLREFIINQWKIEKNFDKLIEDCVLFLTK